MSHQVKEFERMKNTGEVYPEATHGNWRGVPGVIDLDAPPPVRKEPVEVHKGHFAGIPGIYTSTGQLGLVDGIKEFGEGIVDGIKEKVNPSPTVKVYLEYGFKITEVRDRFGNLISREVKKR